MVLRMSSLPDNILDKIVEQKQREVAQMPARLIAAGDLPRRKWLFLWDSLFA